MKLAVVETCWVIMQAISAALSRGDLEEAGELVVHLRYIERIGEAILQKM